MELPVFASCLAETQRKKLQCPRFLFRCCKEAVSQIGDFGL